MILPPREKLARLLAERLNQADQGLEQLMLLLNMPDVPDAKRAEWLSLIANWHIHSSPGRGNRSKNLRTIGSRISAKPGSRRRPAAPAIAGSRLCGLTWN